jgi:hypothetical protein
MRMKTQLAAALLGRGEIPWKDACKMGEANFLSLYERHHVKRRAEGGGDEFHNLEWMLYVEHRKRTREIDVPAIAKNKRLRHKQERHLARMAAKGRSA